MAEAHYACSLTDEELAARRKQWKVLEKRTLLRNEPLPDGRLLVYRAGEETDRILTTLIDAERECCPFIGFAVEQRGDELLLTIRFPLEASSAAAELGIARLD